MSDNMEDNQNNQNNYNLSTESMYCNTNDLFTVSYSSYNDFLFVDLNQNQISRTNSNNSIDTVDLYKTSSCSDKNIVSSTDTNNNKNFITKVLKYLCYCS